MNENDARVRYTRMVIEKTFFGLLREKNADKITVTELCTRAGINRATFYKHYEDIGMLMESEVQSLIAEVEQILRECRPENAGNLTLKILLHMRENREKYALLSLRGSQWEIPRRMFELLYASTYPILAEKLPLSGESAERTLFHFVSGGSAGVLSAWMIGGMAEEPEVVAGRIMALCRGAAESMLQFDGRR